MRFLIIIIFLILTNIASAQSKNVKSLNWVHSNIIDDYSTCVAFFDLGSDILKKLEKKELAQIYESYIQTLGKRITMLGKKSNFNDNILNKKLDLAYQTLQNEINFAVGVKNPSIVLDKYGPFCLDVFQTPENRMKYWADKAVLENR
jgi:hypothetical protein